MAGPSRKEQIEQMLALDPADAFLRYALAMELASAGEDDRAIDQFQALLADTPDYGAAYYQCGLALIRRGRIAEAQQVLQRGAAVARRAGDARSLSETEELLNSLREDAQSPQR